MIIRNAGSKDLGAINEIYNQSIPSGKSTADLFPVSVESRKRWYYQHNKYKYPVFVAEEKGQVLGWISLSAYRPGRLALQHVAEVSYFIQQDHQGKGIGTMLLGFIIQHCFKYQLKHIIAILLEHNTASIRLLENFGFQRWGWMPKIAEFEEKQYGHLYYGLSIHQSNDPKLRLASKENDFITAGYLFNEYASSLDFNLCFQDFEKELSEIHIQYTEPDGGLLILSVDESDIGCVGIRYLEDSICELKRMYIHPSYRGKGYGELLLNAAISLARHLGYTSIRLDTHSSMQPAIKLYKEKGFREINAYRHNPHNQILFFQFDIF